MLRMCDFREKLCSWKAHCISLVLFSILVKGTPVDFFNSFHRLRKGNPLSPLLFVVVMEALSKMLTAAVDRALLLSFSVGTRLFVGQTLIIFAISVFYSYVLKLSQDER